MPSFVFGRFGLAEFRLPFLLIAASIAAGQEPMPVRWRLGPLYAHVPVRMSAIDVARLVKKDGELAISELTTRRLQ